VRPLVNPPRPQLPTSPALRCITSAVDTAYDVLTGADRFQFQVFRSPPTPLWGSNTSSSLSSDPKDPGGTFWGPEPGVGSLRRRRSPSLNPLMPTRCRSAPSVCVPAYMAHSALPRLKFRHHTTPDASSLLLHLADRAPSAVAMVAKRRCSCA